jgi:hypothetical protein
MKRKIEEQKNHKVMKEFGLKSIPNLDVCVLGALELLSDEKIPKIDIKFKRPLVVGSGNAEVAGRIIFSDRDAVFASESDFESKLNNVPVDGVVLVSASGGKHAPIIAKASKKYDKRVVLITTKEDSPAGKYSDKVYIFPKQREPYTYNTSTYMSMILGKSGENPKKIYEFISKEIDKINFSRFKNYDKYFVVVPTEFSEIKRMLEVKFIELFGRKIARDVETSEYVKHATTIVPSKEMFLVFHEKSKKPLKYSKNQVNVPLPKNADYGTMMAIGYYVVGKIQGKKEPWFKDNIVKYTKKASEIFDEEIGAIVD